ncbi:DUF488 domain-containing protein [Pseudidiomarina andamanensis]|uniref:DUF488 family protein n=1 Tax=Pseudidiomarina andamanensis TaxID=1940690 RepID=A0AA92ETI8_9GAMM|nr:DUF488 family protein [Pseudidiomarina andamanensis]MDS0219220.1 DUF488 family protein [Pseudidiomarina andamanensis]QGT95960.1 DUF488 family protein [Pseudidiomarina andamanensis]
MTTSYSIKFKRVYDEAEDSDGIRILVDRLWPRGVKKEALSHHDWCKEACPSNELRKAYHANKIEFETFAKRYFDELSANPNNLTPLLRYARQSQVTLLSAVKSFEHSHLPVLKHAIIEALKLEDQEADGNNLSSPVCFGKDFNYWG